MRTKAVPLVVALVVAVLVTTTTLAAPTTAASPSAAQPWSTAEAPYTPTPHDVSWQSAGDSYSSGEGVYGNKGDCAQSDQAYGPLVARTLQEPPWNWEMTNETFTACTGHLVEDFFNPRNAKKSSLWDWGREQGGPGRVDVITMSFGGNDIGFADVITDCLVVVPDNWKEFVGAGIASSLTGCDISEKELDTRADDLLDPPRRNCTENRRKNHAYDCDMALDGRRGSIIDFYYDVVTRHLTDRGRLYVVGYPRLFADTDQWPWWAKTMCAGVKRGDTQKLGRSAEYLNNKLQEAVDRANEALGSDRVVFIDRFAAYRDGQHELCGRGEDWLNGVSAVRGDGVSLRKQTSFHPNAAGHRGTAELMTPIVAETFPPDYSGCPPDCDLNDRDDYLAYMNAVMHEADPESAGLYLVDRREGADWALHPLVDAKGNDAGYVLFIYSFEPVIPMSLGEPAGYEFIRRFRDRDDLCQWTRATDKASYEAVQLAGCPEG